MKPMRSLIFALVAFLGSCSAALALTCRADISDINFGAVSVRAGASNQTSGLVNIQCSGALVSIVGVCLQFGPGSGGAGGGNSPRRMRRSDGAALSYQLRPSGNGTTFGTLNTLYVAVPIILGAGSATVPIYADITSATVAVGSGLYQSTFSGAGDIEMTYGVVACNLPGDTASVPPFDILAEVVPSCELDVGALNFGAIPSALNTPVDQSAQINVRCTSDTSYSVTLGMGGGGGNNPGQRKLSNGPHTLRYGLYRDSGRGQPWGPTTASGVAATGTGMNSAFTVYGRIHSGQTARIGVYTDNVVVTVNY